MAVVFLSQKWPNSRNVRHQVTLEKTRVHNLQQITSLPLHCPIPDDNTTGDTLRQKVVQAGATGTLTAKVVAPTHQEGYQGLE